MPTSTLLQLVARGRQDAYLTSNPQTTLFKQVYRRYTPFAVESIPIEFDGTPDFGKRISCILPRKAELLSSLFLEIDLPALPEDTSVDPAVPYYWVNDIGHAIIEDVSIEIGDKEIDKHTGEWLQIWSELTVPADKRDGYNQMIGHWDVYPDTKYSPGPLRLTIPLRFWFCNSLGAALPLIALQAHPVRIIIRLRKFEELWWSAEKMDPATQCNQIDPISITRVQLYGDYVFLGDEERQKFAVAEHEYLIDQLQYTPVQSLPKGIQTANIPLYFNNAVKEFIWVVQQERMHAAREWFNYGNLLQADGGEAGIRTDLLESAIIRLDGYERFQRRHAQYFRMTQPYQHHTRIPPNTFIYLYSFSMKPEEDQPSGSINCSKIDDIMLSLAFDTTQTAESRRVVVYATNYNTLRIVGGLGGLAFIA